MNRGNQSTEPSQPQPSVDSIAHHLLAGATAGLAVDVALFPLVRNRMGTRTVLVVHHSYWNGSGQSSLLVLWMDVPLFELLAYAGYNQNPHAKCIRVLEEWRIQEYLCWNRISCYWLSTRSGTILCGLRSHTQTMPLLFKYILGLIIWEINDCCSELLIPLVCLVLEASIGLYCACIYSCSSYPQHSSSRG